MSTKRTERVNELLQREIASGLYRLQTTPALDLARVTIASVDCSPDLRNATVSVSVLEDETGETRAPDVLRVLNRHRKDLQNMVSSHVVLKYTPHLRFELDTGQAKADRIYQILDSLPPPADDNPDEEDSTDGSPTT